MNKNLLNLFVLIFLINISSYKVNACIENVIDVCNSNIAKINGVSEGCSVNIRCGNRNPASCICINKDNLDTTCVNMVDAVGGSYVHLLSGNTAKDIVICSGPKNNVENCVKKLIPTRYNCVCDFAHGPNNKFMRACGSKHIQ